MSNHGCLCFEHSDWINSCTLTKHLFCSGDAAVAAKDKAVEGANTLGSVVTGAAVAVKDTAVSAGETVVEGVKTVGGAIRDGAVAAGNAVGKSRLLIACIAC